VDRSPNLPALKALEQMRPLLRRVSLSREDRRNVRHLWNNAFIALGGELEDDDVGLTDLDLTSLFANKPSLTAPEALEQMGPLLRHNPLDGRVLRAVRYLWAQALLALGGELEAEDRKLLEPH
jgi:hypothetical protein